MRARHPAFRGAHRRSPAAETRRIGTLLCLFCWHKGNSKVCGRPPRRWAIIYYLPYEETFPSGSAGSTGPAGPTRRETAVKGRGGRSAGEPPWCVGEGVRRQLPSGRKAVRAGVLSSGAE